MRPLFSAVAIALPFAASCDQSQPGQTAAPTTATPVLDAYRTVWDQLDGAKVGALTAHLYPGRATIQIDASAPPNTRQDLIDYLNSIQPQLHRIIELSPKTPEPFPPHPSEKEIRIRNGFLDHPMAWMQNFARLLNADAMRCWESGDAAATIQRVIASTRLGEAMQSQSDDLDRITGVGIMGQGLKLALALLDAGLASKASPESLAQLRTAANAFTIRQQSEAPSLSGMVNQDLQQLRQNLAN